jgi:hypothetical protein
MIISRNLRHKLGRGNIRIDKDRFVHVRCLNRGPQSIFWLHCLVTLIWRKHVARLEGHMILGRRRSNAVLSIPHTGVDKQNAPSF